MLVPTLPRAPLETLGQKQRRFPLMVASLIQYIYSQGYECTLGDAFRDPRVFGVVGVTMGYGHPSSAHKRKLAIDLNLFKDGVYLDKTEDHRPIGEWWERQGGTWGGRFNDGNHYSLEHGGVQ